MVSVTIRLSTSKSSNKCITFNKLRIHQSLLLSSNSSCISESSIPVVVQHSKRSKLDTSTTSTRTHKEEKKDEEEEGCLDNEESLSGENLRTTLPTFQKMFKNIKNFSQLFEYKNDREPEMGMEIGLPTDVKHVTHIGFDGCASSIFSKGFKNLSESELINLHSFPLTELELAIKAQAPVANERSLLDNECNVHDNAIV